MIVMQQDNRTKQSSRKPFKSQRLHPQWVIGFTDSAGCFSVSIVKNSSTKIGLQVFPEFVIADSSKNLKLLKKLRGFFRCGRVYQTTREIKKKELLSKFCVRSQKELHTKIVPFFINNPLKTEKNKQFKIFVRILELFSRQEHLHDAGIKKIAKLATSMNTNKKRQ